MIKRMLNSFYHIFIFLGNNKLKRRRTNEKENIPLTNVVTFGTNMIPGILLATVALFVLAAISKLFYGKKDKKHDK